jgi:hypothetical protein
VLARTHSDDGACELTTLDRDIKGASDELAADWPEETSHCFQRHIVTQRSFRKEAPTWQRESA